MDCIYCPSASHLLLCMDVERNPGPQRVSDLPPTTIELFNKIKRNKLKLVRYKSHLINFTTYSNGNLIPKGLLPKCTPAIHYNNPLFWSQWNQNLNHLAKTQLQLLIEETENQITAFETILNEQLEALKTAVYDHATYMHLSDLIDNMALSRTNQDSSYFTVDQLLCIRHKAHKACVYIPSLQQANILPALVCFLVQLFVAVLYSVSLAQRKENSCENPGRNILETPPCY